ncbi:MAG TPA: hypothetical protein VMD02_01730 [Candidatus Omnitrophota bacterium]|nr:hypothetical protein [Candidatus Omnitrophota bacterium]
MLIVCEPECRGFAHERINAYYLYALSLSLPGEKILFIAEKGHIKCIKENLSGRDANIEYMETDIPDPARPYLRQIRPFIELDRKLFRLAEERGADRLIYLSISSVNLYLIKYLLKREKRINKCLIVLHGILETLNHYPYRGISRVTDFLFWFRNPLLMKHGSEKIEYLALSQGIKDRLVSKYRSLAKNIHVTFFPYLFSEPPAAKASFAGGSVRFGSFGGIKAPGQLLALIERVNAVKSIHRPEFVIIGPGDGIKFPEGVVVPSPNKRMDRQEMDKYAVGVNYALYVYPRGGYDLMASGALFDAISYQKPMIAIRNPFFEECFAIFGDIGYLCEDTDEMFEVMSAILKTPPDIKYEVQRQNLVRAKGITSPDRTAGTLKRLLEVNA